MALPKYEYADWDHLQSGCQPGAKTLMAWITANVAGATNLGCFNPSTIPGSTTLSIHAEGRAIDPGTPDDDARDAMVVFLDRLVQVADVLGVQCIIHQKRIWSTAVDTAVKPFASWRELSNWRAVGDHLNHAHIELTREAAGITDPTSWLTTARIDDAINGAVHVAAPPAPPIPQGDDMHKIIVVLLPHKDEATGEIVQPDPARRDPVTKQPLDPQAWARFFGGYDGVTVKSMHWLKSQRTVDRYAALGYENVVDSAGRIVKENVLYIPLDSCGDIFLEGPVPYAEDQEFERNVGRRWSPADFLPQ